MSTNEFLPKDPREERAIDALIAGILKASSRNEEVDDLEIAPFVQPDAATTLSVEAERSLAKLGPRPLEKILLPLKATLHLESGQHEEDLEVAGEFCGMYRNNPTGENAPEDDAELERKRREALKKLREAQQRGDISDNGEGD